MFIYSSNELNYNFQNSLINNPMNENIITNNNQFINDPLLSNFKINHIFFKTLFMFLLLSLYNWEDRSGNNKDKITSIIFYSYCVISLICYIYSNKNRLKEKSVLYFLIIQFIFNILLFLAFIIEKFGEYEIMGQKTGLILFILNLISLFIFFIISLIYKFKLIWLNICVFNLILIAFIVTESYKFKNINEVIGIIYEKIDFLKDKYKIILRSLIIIIIGFNLYKMFWKYKSYDKNKFHYIYLILNILFYCLTLIPLKKDYSMFLSMPLFIWFIVRCNFKNNESLDNNQDNLDNNNQDNINNNQDNNLNQDNINNNQDNDNINQYNY